MSLTISDERVNSQAVALEIARNEIIMDIEKSLGVSDAPVSLRLLRKRVEEYTIEIKFEEIKKLIVQHLATHTEEITKVPDYRVELYLRTFVVDAFLENRYLSLLDLLKTKMINDLILKFPIETLVLEDSIPGLLGVKMPEEGVSFVRRPIKNFLTHLNLSGNFDTLVTMLVAQVRFLECVVKDDPKATAKARDLAMDNRITAKVLERNCSFVLDLCVELAQAILANYHVARVKDEDEIERLESDFKNFVIERLTHDSRILGKLTPKDLADAVAIESRKAWKAIKSNALQDLEKRASRSECLTRYDRDEIAKKMKKDFNETLEKNFSSIFGFIPRKDLFLKHSNDCVSASVDRILDRHFARVSSATLSVAESLKFEIGYLLSLMLKADTVFRFKYFPVLPQFDPDVLLPSQLRKWLVVSAATGAPLTFDPKETKKTVDTLQGLASALDVQEDKDVKKAIESYEKDPYRSSSGPETENIWSQAQAVIESLIDGIHPRDIAYLLLGLYFVVTDGERDLLELRRAVAKNDVASFRPPHFGRRQILMRIARLFKDGRSPLLNYQVILLVESLLEKLRATHNRFVSLKVLKRPLLGLYNLDYSEAIESIRKLAVKDLAKLVKSDPVSPDQRDMIFKFVTDMKFRNPNTARDDQTMIVVDADLTIEQETEGPLLERLGGTSPSKESSANHDEKVAEQKLLGKLQYLKETVRKFQLVPLHPETAMRSRCPILCISGFVSEDTDLVADWHGLLELYPFTEMVCLNWESFTAKDLAAGVWDSIRHVSFKSLTNLMVDSLGKVMDDRTTDKKNIDKDYSRKMPSIVSNPFQEQDLREDKQDYLEDEETKEVTPKPKLSLWGLWRRYKLSSILSRENLLKVTTCY